MKKLSVLLSTCLIITGIFCTARALTINAIDGDWIGTTGGVNVKYANNITVAYGNGAEDQVRWTD